MFASDRMLRFDTEQIIQDLMRVERLKVDRFYQQRQTLEWRNSTVINQ